MTKHPDAQSDSWLSDELTRRGALGIAARAGALLSLGGLLGTLGACSATKARSDSGLLGTPIPGNQTAHRSNSPVHHPQRPRPRIATTHSHPAPLPTQRVPISNPVARSGAPTPGVIARGHWAKGNPKKWLADKMVPVRRITIHHDGMGTQPTGGWGNSVHRLESIRRGHLSNGWADIGYHYAVDPSGRVWACRPMTLQGAHVKDNNPGNLGIVVLGNFQNTRPTNAAKRSLAQFVTAQMHRYRVPPSRVVTHRELRPTACPGQHLQQFMNWTRAPGGTLASVRV